MPKRLAPFYKRASPNMDELSDYTSSGTPYSFVSCPLAVVTREPLPQCAVDRGLPAVYCARLYVHGNFKIVDKCLYPDPAVSLDGEGPSLSCEINVMVISNDAGSPAVNAAYGYVDEEDYLWKRCRVGNPEEIAHTTLLRLVQHRMYASCDYRFWHGEGKEDNYGILSDDGTYPGYEDAYFGVIDWL